MTVDRILVSALAAIAMLGSYGGDASPFPEEAPPRRPRPLPSGPTPPARTEPSEPSHAELLAIEKRKRKAAKRLAEKARRK